MPLASSGNFRGRDKGGGGLEGMARDIESIVYPFHNTAFTPEKKGFWPARRKTDTCKNDCLAFPNSNFIKPT